MKEVINIKIILKIINLNLKGIWEKINLEL